MSAPSTHPSTLDSAAAPAPDRATDPAIDEFPVRYAATARFTLGSPRNLTVTPDGGRVLFCRSAGGDDPVLRLWVFEVATGQERLLVDPAELAEESGELPPAERARRERARESAAGITSFALDDTGSTACFALAGSLFVVDVTSGEVTVPAVEGSVFDPRLAPDASAVAYVDGTAHGADLRLVELDPPRPDRVLRSDPDPLVSYGRAEFVAAEEMGRHRGFWWSPDGARLLVARVDETPVPEWFIADPARPEQAPNVVRYPAAGSANARVGLELVDRDGTTRPVAWDDDGAYEYLADVHWSNGLPPLLVRQTRDQRRISLATVDLEAGSVSEVRAISDEVWVELLPGSPRWSPAGLLTVEDDDRARRLLLDGHPLTPDGIQVRALAGVAPAADGRPALAVVTATLDGAPTEVQIMAVPLSSGDGQLGDPGPGLPATGVVPLTREPAVHQAAVGGSTLVTVTASPDHHRPRVTVDRLGDGGPGDGTGPATIGDLSADPGFRAEPTFLALGDDGLATALFLPSWYDGTLPLPVLLDPYGGPHAQRVLRTHNAHLVSRWFAEQGYAVVVADGRGTPGRGPAWERAVAGNLADPVLDDQLAALDAVLDRHPFLDRDRVGIRGWSFGGYLAALAVLRRPDRFHAAVAGAPVTTWRLYDTHYTERYLGDPEVDAAPYDRSDLWIDGPDGPEIPALTRPLLLIHGLADDNVVAAHTLRFSTTLLATGSPHRVLPLVGVTHMTPQLAVAENLLRLQLAFLDETLGRAAP